MGKRKAHASCCHGDQLFVFGGKTPAYASDICSFNIKKSSWEKYQLKGKLPTGRYGSTMVSYNNSLWIFGGFDELSMSCDDLWRLNINTLTMEKIPTKVQGEKPLARHQHSSVVIGKV